MKPVIPRVSAIQHPKLYLTLWGEIMEKQIEIAIDDDYRVTIRYPKTMNKIEIMERVVFSVIRHTKQGQGKRRKERLERLDGILQTMRMSIANELDNLTNGG
jgi:hypothetical protein